MGTGLSRKLAVILHADVVSSTRLVHLDETLAHERIRDTFQRFSDTIRIYNGVAHEIRGDALVAEFHMASDAVSASLAFQVANAAHIDELADEVRPVLRVGISIGEVVVADNTVTGDGVVLAQRLEQLAEPGGVVIHGAAYETVPKRLPFDYEDLGDLELKGFDGLVKAFAVKPRPGETGRGRAQARSSARGASACNRLARRTPPCCPDRNRWPIPALTRLACGFAPSALHGGGWRRCLACSSGNLVCRCTIRRGCTENQRCDAAGK